MDFYLDTELATRHVTDLLTDALEITPLTLPPLPHAGPTGSFARSLIDVTAAASDYQQAVAREVEGIADAMASFIARAVDTDADNAAELEGMLA